MKLPRGLDHSVARRQHGEKKAIHALVAHGYFETIYHSHYGSGRTLPGVLGLGRRLEYAVDSSVSHPP